MDIADGKVEQK